MFFIIYLRSLEPASFIAERSFWFCASRALGRFGAQPERR